MKSKLIKVFFVTYSDDDTKAALMAFDSSLADAEIENLISGYLKKDETLTEFYDDDNLNEAAKLIVGGDSWCHMTEEYYLEDVTEYY